MEVKHIFQSLCGSFIFRFQRMGIDIQPKLFEKYNIQEKTS